VRGTGSSTETVSAATQGGSWDDELCECHFWWEDPLMIALDRGPIELTDVVGGVWFDANSDGRPDRLAWTAPGSRVGILVLDRDGDGVIENGRELLGRAVEGMVGRKWPTAGWSGFTALAMFDRPEWGGNGDGALTSADAAFARLRQGSRPEGLLRPMTLGNGATTTA
jgi:hypothetical protein